MDKLDQLDFFDEVLDALEKCEIVIHTLVMPSDLALRAYAVETALQARQLVLKLRAMKLKESN